MARSEGRERERSKEKGVGEGEDVLGAKNKWLVGREVCQSRS